MTPGFLFRAIAVVGWLTVTAWSGGCGPSVTPDEARRAVDDVTNPDRRRAGIAVLAVEYPDLRHPPLTVRYQQLAQHDPDPTVRAMAVRALNLCRDGTATKVFVASLNDESEQVRLEAAKALANVPDERAVGPLLERLGNRRPTTTPGYVAMRPETEDVRIAAADALRHYRTLDVARTLVSTLAEPDFGIAWQARQSLVFLTGRDLQYDEAAWLKYLVGPEKPFG